MKRMFVYVFAGLGGVAPLILDSAIKGVLLLGAAVLAAVLMRKASASARHLVWVVAVVALLVLPVLSVGLPQWRVLPAWLGGETAVLVPEEKEIPQIPQDGTTGTLAEGTGVVPAPVGMGGSSPSGETGRGVSNFGPEAVSAFEPIGGSKERVDATTGDFLGWFALVWTVGFGVLLVRLLGAHFLLKSSVRGCELVKVSDPLSAIFLEVRREIGVGERVGLLMDPRRTVPVVWGVWRPRLLLPAEAREWGEGKLRSVLLHELAHLKRRDPLIQMLGQVACALHWWNPLAWVAAWRLHVERERACDDLVLSSGVRASAYAEHLLEVATRLSPARWTSACGLAMARESSLEGRLRAVLSGGMRRGRVSLKLGMVALLVGVAIAVPVAMLRAADGDEEGWNPPSSAHSGGGEFSTFCVHDGEVAAFVVAYRGDFNSSSSGGSNRKGRSWTDAVRLELKGEDGGKVEVFLRREHTKPGTLVLGGVGFDLKKGRLFLLDEAGGVRQMDMEVPVVRNPEAAEAFAEQIEEELEPGPVGEIADEAGGAKLVKGGRPLPQMLESAAWGEPGECGLRAAWMLEPRGLEVPIGSVMKSRVLFHNAGKATVVFQTDFLHGRDPHSARDAEGKAIRISRTTHLGTRLRKLVTYRLKPGEYCEVRGYGIAVGAGGYEGEFSSMSIDSVIEAEVGDRVKFSSVVGAGGNVLGEGSVEFWNEIVASMVERETAMLEPEEDREQLVRRVSEELFGSDPTGEEIKAFANDKSAESMARLTKRLQRREGVEVFAGNLPTGDFTFRVAEPDPEAAHRVRTATKMGRYTLGAEWRLDVRHHIENGERKRFAKVVRLEKEAERVLGEIELPGYAAYAFAWKREAGEFFLLTAEEARRFVVKDGVGLEGADLKLEAIGSGDLHMGLVNAYNEVAVELAGGGPLPARLVPRRGTLACEVYWSSVIEADGMDYNPGERFDPDELAELAKSKDDPRRLSWLISRAGAERDGRFRYLLEDEKPEEDPGVALALLGYDYAMNGNVEALQIILDSLGKRRPGADAQELIPLAFIDEWEVTVAAYEKHFSKGTDGAGGLAADFFWLERQCLFPEAFDRYRSKERDGTISAPVRPGDAFAQMLFAKWRTLARGDGKIPGALLGRLAAELDGFLQVTPENRRTKEVAALRSRMKTSRDWEQGEVVELLDALVAIPYDLRGAANRDVTFSEMRRTYPGRPLPDGFEDLKWGETAKCGLRVAWLMENQLGGLRKARLIFHNTGVNPVFLRTQGWKREEFPTARPMRRGDYVEESGAVYRSQSAMINWRLGPGEYCEAGGFRLTIGAGENADDYAVALVTALKKAEIHERVNFWHSKGAGAEGKLGTMMRVAHEGPTPHSAEERAQLVRRVMLDVYGTGPSEEEIASFVARPEVDWLGNLQFMLKQKRGELFFVGGLSANQLNFEILPAEGDGAKGRGGKEDGRRSPDGAGGEGAAKRGVRWLEPIGRQSYFEGRIE